MNTLYCILPLLLVVVQRSLASFPHVAVEEEPAVAVAAEPVAHVPVATAHVAPVVAAAPAVAPAPYPYPYPYPHMYPYAYAAPYHHPRTEVHNVVKAYQKEAGHVSKTAMVSEGGHLPGHFGLHPAGHFAGGLGLPIPFRSRLHREKLAKKVHKSFDKKKH
ncbi:hypothetical protein Y032_0183g936 [Ancylostoma ceylanicum]|uniref:Uncharacterized protein n=1 Tax=Ancylostoma ceylanicum TaxID=53326 RepID=A0A016SSL1_9BILA|nr:hypothetical protein Y032_0183g936 [Ancylostoma ceylanicum]